MKLMRSDEERIIQKAKKQKAEQDKIINEIEAKKLKRQAKIDAVETKYGNEIQRYRMQTQQYGIDAPALVRLLL